jgi:hypothetical protein
VAGLLPPDSISNGFDNVADAQAFSATLMESYLRASAKVTALAIGDKEAAATETNYRVPKTASQLSRVEGAPFGTRGGISTPHTFPGRRRLRVQGRTAQQRLRRPLRRT